MVVITVLHAQTHCLFIFCFIETSTTSYYNHTIGLQQYVKPFCINIFSFGFSLLQPMAYVRIL